MKQPKKSLFILLLLLLCVSLLAVGTYAAYITSDSAKQVVLARTRDAGENLRFSSNLLFPRDLADTNYEERSLSVSNSGDATISIVVCNYPQSDPASFNDKNINYTMTVIGPEGVSDITFSPQAGTLQGGKPSSVSHTITIPADNVTAVSNGYLTVVVEPTDEASKEATLQNKLAANLKIVLKEAAPSGWSGELKFDGASEKNDAINFYIHGTKECNMKLSWGPKIVLGDWSKELLGVRADAKSPITIHVGGPGQPTSYYLQFYRLAPAEAGETIKTLGISFDEVS